MLLTGSISRSLLSLFLHFVHTTAKALDRVFDNMDIDADGLISEEEFLSCFGFGPLRDAAARVQLQV